MGSIRVRQDNGLLFFDFRYKNKRCREQSILTDNKSNRNKMEAVLKRLEKEIVVGTFDYATYFPNSNNLKKFSANENINEIDKPVEEDNPNGHPLFSDFADTWISENEITWRDSHKKTQLGVINGYLKDNFGDKVVSQIKKAEILAFRSKLAILR